MEDSVTDGEWTDDPAREGWMTPLAPEQGGLTVTTSEGDTLVAGDPATDPNPNSLPYDSVYQHPDTGAWYFEYEGMEDQGPFLSEIGAREGLKAYQEAEEKTKPHTVGPAMTLLDDEMVELDPEAAEHRLSHAAQELVNAAIHLVRGTKSDVIVDRGDMKALRVAVEEFDVAYATVATVGKLMALANQAEQQPAGEPVVDATYGEVPQEKLDARYEEMIAERQAELDAAECLGEVKE